MFIICFLIQTTLQLLKLCLNPIYFSQFNPLTSQDFISFLKNQNFFIQIQDMSIHVGIIGAGLSGLTAARQLLNKNQKIKVTVLQANDRVGGRTLTIDVKGNHYDMGASFIGKTQVDVIQLANQANNQLIPQFQTGKKVMDVMNQISTYSSTIPNNVSIFSLIKMQWVLWKINRMAKKVPVDNPSQCQYAAIWDSMTLSSWIAQNTSNQKVKKMVEAAIRIVYGAQLTELSFLYFLWYVHQSQNFDNLVNIGDGLQQKKLKLGTQQLSIFLAQQIKVKKGQIIIKTFVKKVTQSEGKCFVQTNDQKYEFDYLIAAIPPANLTKIQFQPQLSMERKLLADRTFMGSIGKLIIRYKECYWRNKGFSGEVLSDGSDSPITLTYDDTKANQNGKIQPAMIVFVGGAVYRHWNQDEEGMKNVTLKKLAEYFSEPKMLTPKSIHYEKWEQNASINGGPVACFPPGLLSQIKELRKPQGKIHWAGTELARRSCGFMDGAIESGKRVAEEILNIVNGNQENMKFSKNQQKKKTQQTYTKFTKKQPVFEWW